MLDNKHLEIWDVVEWKAPEDPTSCTWVVTGWFSGHSDVKLSEKVRDFRTEAPKGPKSALCWLILTAVGQDGCVAVGEEQLISEGKILNSSLTEDEDCDEYDDDYDKEEVEDGY